MFFFTFNSFVVCPYGVVRDRHSSLGKRGFSSVKGGLVYHVDLLFVTVHIAFSVFVRASRNYDVVRVYRMDQTDLLKKI